MFTGVRFGFCKAHGHIPRDAGRLVKSCISGRDLMVPRDAVFFFAAPSWSRVSLGKLTLKWGVLMGVLKQTLKGGGGFDD